MHYTENHKAAVRKLLSKPFDKIYKGELYFIYTTLGLSNLATILTT
jgi:hypothetical protein